MLRRVPESGVVSTRLVRLPGRGTTRVWECPGPPGAETLVLIHGVTFTAELNWAKVLDTLGREFRVLALDQRGHGQGIPTGPRFRLEDCADDVAALAAELGVDKFVAVGYSMGGIIAQLMYRRHRPLVSGLVLCATARSVRGSPTERLITLGLPAMAATMPWNPMAHMVTAEIFGAVMLGHIEDAATREWVRDQLRRTNLATALSAVQAVCEFSSHDWIHRVDVPTAVVVTTKDDIVPAARQHRLARAIPGAVVHEIRAGHGVAVNAPALFGRGLLAACRTVTRAPADSPLPSAATLNGPA